MRRYIVFLLITGIVWAQTDLYDYDLPYDEYIGELILKDGTTYLGEYSKTEGDVVYFKPQNVFAFQPISKNTLALEEYQKLSTEEKGIYDAKSKNLGKWYLFGPMSTILFVGCVVLNMGLNDFSTPIPIFLGVSLAASLTIPYFVLNRKEKINFPKSIMTDSEKEIYEQAYSKKLKQRKIKYAVGSTILTGAVFVGVVLYSLGQAMSDFDMGPQPPGPW